MLSTLTPCDIDEVWPQVRARALPWLEGVDGGEAALLRECREKRAFCWRSAQAVLVLSLAPTPDGQLDLFVRTMVSFEPTTDAVDRVLPDLDRIAADLGAARIRFRTLREGWRRALSPRWRVAHVEYATDVRAS
jgi:hypothetical protein